MNELLEAVRRIVRQLDKSDIASISFSEAHINMNCVVDMESGRGYVIRVHLGWLGVRPSDQTIVRLFRRQQMVNDLLRKDLGLPAPEIFLIDDSRTILNDVYMISERKPGTLAERLLGWLSSADRKELLRQAGSALRRIHSLVMSQPGIANVRGIPVDQSEYNDLTRFLMHLSTDLLVLKNRGLLKSDTVKQIDDLYQKHFHTLQAEYEKHCLVHCDYNLRNILFDFDNTEGALELSGILDTEGARIGSPVHDFMSLELWSFLRSRWLTNIVPAAQMRSWFFEGYGDAPNIIAYKLIYLRRRLSSELLDMGYLDERFVLELDGRELPEDLTWLKLPE